MLKKPLLLGVLFAFLGLLCLVLRANDALNNEMFTALITGGYLFTKITQRKKGYVSKRSANISITITVIGLALYVTHNTYAYSVLGFALISDLIFPLIFKKK
jgi:hypothetical protein